MLNMLFAAGTEKENFVDVVIPSWGWPMLLVVVAGALMIDLLIFHRKAHVIEIREAAIESAVWIGLGLAFTGVIAWMFSGQGEGTSSAVEYLSGYLIEKSLSVDNVFVWAMIFAHFKVPREYQHRTLFGEFSARSFCVSCSLSSASQSLRGSNSCCLCSVFSSSIQV